MVVQNILLDSDRKELTSAVSSVSVLLSLPKMLFLVCKGLFCELLVSPYLQGAFIYCSAQKTTKYKFIIIGENRFGNYRKCASDLIRSAMFQKQE